MINKGMSFSLEVQVLLVSCPSLNRLFAVTDVFIGGVHEILHVICGTIGSKLFPETTDLGNKYFVIWTDDLSEVQ
jgi:hypothetical protein